MAVIKSGATSDQLTVDPVSKAARATLYDAAGVPIVFGSGGTSAVDGATFTPSTTVGTPIMGERDDAGTVVADLKLGIPRLTSKRAQHVTLYDSAGVEITSFGGGTEYTEDAPAAANPVGAALILVREDARAGGLTSLDGDNVAQRGNNKGEAYVKATDSDALLTTIDLALGVIDDWDESDRAKVNPIVGQAGVAGGSGVVGATTQRVVLATDVALPAGSNAIGKLAANSGVDIGDIDVTSVVPGTGATNLGKAADAIAGATDVGVAPLAIRDDVLPVVEIVPVEGDYTPLRTDKKGALWTRDSALEAAVETNRVAVNPIAGQIGIAGGGGTVSATTTRATLAADDPAVASLAIIDDWDETDRAKVNIIAGQVGVSAGAGAVATNTPRLTLASDDPAVAVLGATTGAAVITDANGTIQQYLRGLVKLFITAGSALVTAVCGGNVAHDDADSGNPVKMGAKAVSSFPAAVATADRVNLITDLYGRLFTRHGTQALANKIWTKQHNPAANTQASAVQAAGGVGIRNVCTGFTVSLCAGATAPAAVQLSVALIDGGTGGATKIWGPTVISLPAIAGSMAAFVRGGLWIPGTANTAMTLEFSAAAGANTIESVTMEGTTVEE